MLWVLDCPELHEAGNLSPGMAQRWRDVSVYFDQAATNEHVPADLLTAIAFVESRWNPFVTSSAGAQGLMQVMPATGRYVADRIGVVWKPWDVEINAVVGAAYLRMVMNRWSGKPIEWAIASYYAGGGNVSKHGPGFYSGYANKVQRARRAVNATQTRCEQGGGGEIPKWVGTSSGKGRGGGAHKKTVPTNDGSGATWPPTDTGGDPAPLITALLLILAAISRR